MREEGSVSSHLHYICIALQSGHEGCLKKGGVEVVAFVAATVTRILTGEYFRSFARVFVIAGTLREEPILGAVKMFVDQINLEIAHLGPEVIELLTLGVGTRRTDDLDFGVLLAQTLHKRFEANYVLGTPLLVADADILHVKRLRMTHLGAECTPFGVYVAIGELYEVEGILNIGVEVINCHMGILAVILILA